MKILMVYTIMFIVNCLFFSSRQNTYGLESGILLLKLDIKNILKLHMEGEYNLVFKMLIGKWYNFLVIIKSSLKFL